MRDGRMLLPGNCEDAQGANLRTNIAETPTHIALPAQTMSHWFRFLLTCLLVLASSVTNAQHQWAKSFVLLTIATVHQQGMQNRNELLQSRRCSIVCAFPLYLYLQRCTFGTPDWTKLYNSLRLFIGETHWAMLQNSIQLAFLSS